MYTITHLIPNVKGVIHYPYPKFSIALPDYCHYPQQCRLIIRASTQGMYQHVSCKYQSDMNMPSNIKYVFIMMRKIMTHNCTNQICVRFTKWWLKSRHIDGLTQNNSNSSVLAMELVQSCSKPLIYSRSFEITHRSYCSLDLSHRYILDLWNNGFHFFNDNHQFVF